MSLAPKCLLAGARAVLGPVSRSWLYQRRQIVRLHADSADEGLALARRDRPWLVLTHRDLPGCDGLVRNLRRDPFLMSCSIGVVSEGDVDERDIELLEAGANGIFRLPPGPDWDRLGDYLGVKVRRETRIPMHARGVVRGTRAGAGWVSTVVDVSESGVRLDGAVTAPFRTGDSLSIEIVNDVDESRVLGAGRAAWIAEGGPCALGIQLREVDGPWPQWLENAWQALS